MGDEIEIEIEIGGGRKGMALLRVRLGCCVRCCVILRTGELVLVQLLQLLRRVRIES